jgi:hypothetical protein
VVLTDRQLKARGLSVTPEQDIPELRMVTRFNRTSGEIYPPTPEGIDIGFGHHHGKSTHLIHGSQIVNDRLGYKLAKVSVQSPDFFQLTTGRIAGEALVGYITKDLLESIGSQSGRVTINHTAVSQLSDIDIGDYQQIPDIIQGGMYVQQGDELFIYHNSPSHVYRVGVSGSAEGIHLELDSLERVDHQTLNEARSSGDILREEL